MENKNFRMVFFPSTEEFHKALQIEEIRAVILGEGPGSIIVPASIVPLIRKRALVSHVLKPSNRAKPTEEQIKATEERRGAFKGDFFITRELLNPNFHEKGGVAHAKGKET